METETLDVDFEMDESICPCLGTGWSEQKKEWKQCPIHFVGQLHPHTQELLMDEPKRLQEEARKSFLQYRIEQQQEVIAKLNERVREAGGELLLLELELINKTPTRRMEKVEFPIESRHQNDG